MEENEMKPEQLKNGDRKAAIDDLEKKQRLILDMITDMKDNYGDYAPTNFMILNAKNVYEQLQKISLMVVTGQDVASEEK